MSDHSVSESLFFDLAASLIPPQSAIYVAGPLATGKAYYDSLAQGIVDADNIRNTNITIMSAFVAHLRSIQPSPVIHSGLLQISEWSPSRVGDFFIELMRRFCFKVCFLDGWEFSHGATKEYLAAMRLNLACYDQRDRSITSQYAHSLLLAASDYVSGLGVDASKLRSRLTEVKSLSASLK